MPKKKRALVVGVGGLRGAYDAGVVATLSRTLGNEYFDAVYASSVGVCVATYFLTGQPDDMEYVWRNDVDGSKLVSLRHLLHGREYLDLKYLVDLFREGKNALRRDVLFKSPAKLFYSLINYTTGKEEYRAPDQAGLFDDMEAAMAIPELNAARRLDTYAYVDGGLFDPLPVERALQDGYEEVLAVYNKCADEDAELPWLERFLYTSFLPRSLRAEFRHRRASLRRIEALLQDPRVQVIRPAKHISLLSILDTTKERINASVDLGIADAQKFLAQKSI